MCIAILVSQSEPKNKDGPLVLVGLMGAGKSTIGRRLAARLNIGFVDADDEIELAAGLSIAEIFERYGEAHFRDGERRVIARLMEEGRQVIATGGGAFIDPDTRSAILANAIAIWLDADIATLAERVARRNHRPLLVGKDPATVLRDLADIRNPFYAQAHIHISSTPTPHVRTVERVVDELESRKLI
ncbi:shikimate kinase [Pacificimonas sp. WHA3]|uniref:Shikimate kinase n=1 Tax=Pacificimonas pallii TaxID=2827236 RepID=A0ABS6SGY7_9SPHN|nr:shikimate kinase [Pacificimonas pallii]MBV7257520.1 shikimate kinase [Pacificimonas pallii]